MQDIVMLCEACLRTINVSGGWAAGQLSLTGPWTSDLHKFYIISISSMCFANILPSQHNAGEMGIDGLYKW